MTRQLRSALISIAILPLLASAQISVDNSQSPSALVQNVLLGGGVSVSNITFNGLPGGSISPQVASFNSAYANVGMPNGLMLATGDATLAYGPNTLDNATQGGYTGNSDPDLGSIAGTSVFDAAVLEFDFVPTGGGISFNFVFASEEYLEFVNTGFNDAFGFFLSGPGISGPYANNAVNIALVPGTSTPVTIDNVNNISNAAFYVDNGDGFSAPYNSSVDYVQYDGLTVSITASHAVQCGQTYHIKLAIGDVSDEIYDSAVFLQAGAFTSTPPMLNLTQDLALPCMGNGQVEVLGLNGADVTWSSNGVALGTGTSMPVTANGSDWYVATVTDECGATATDSVNVSSVPPQLNVPSTLGIACGEQGTLSMTLTQMGGGDHDLSWSSNGTLLSTTSEVTIAPPTEPAWFVASVSDACGSSVSDSTLVSSTVAPITISVNQPAPMPCDGNGGILTVTINGDTAGIAYLWTNAGIEVGASHTLNISNEPAEYTVMVTNGCGASATSTVTTTLQSYDAIVVGLTPDATVTCPGQSAGASVLSVTGGTGVFTQTWTDANGTALGTANSFTVPVSGSQTYTLTATDNCGHAGSAQVTLSVAEHAPLALHLADAMVCEGGSRELIAVATGGAGAYTYAWPAFPGADSAVTVAPTVPSSYTVTVTDLCGSTAQADAQVGIEHPVTTILAESIGFNDFAFSTHSLPAAVDFTWSFGDGHTGTSSAPEHAYAEMQPTIVKVHTLTANGCPAIDTIALTPAAQLFFPNAFTPNGDGINDTFGAVGVLLEEFELVIFDRWGAEVAAITGVGATWNGEMKNGETAPTGVYVYSFRAAGERLEETKGLGHVTLLGDESATN